MSKITGSIRMGRFAAFAATMYRSRSIRRHCPYRTDGVGGANEAQSSHVGGNGVALVRETISPQR
jgi:hypothetical protein